MKAKGSLAKQEVEIEASKEEVEGFFNAIIPDFVRNAGGILSDNVRYWRWQNQIVILQKVKQKVEASGLPKQQIPLKVLVPIIEHSSLEEEESLREKWANMLSNAITSKVDINPNFVAILSELSPTEVKILDQLHNESSKEGDYAKRRSMRFGRNAICQAFGLSTQDADLIIENLFRLGLCQPPAGDGIMVGPHKFTLRTTEMFEFTALGFQFVSACKW